MHKRRQRILVSDFDGTMTKFDFFDLARRDLPSNADHDFWQDYVDGRITHFEALQGIFGSIRADWAGIERVLAGMQLDPTLKDSVARLRAAGWEIVVASAGCGWYIERLLGQAGVELDVHANPGAFAPETGLRLALPDGLALLQARDGHRQAGDRARRLGARSGCGFRRRRPARPGAGQPRQARQPVRHRLAGAPFPERRRRIPSL